LAIIEESEPVAKENEITPIIINRIHRSFSVELMAEMSPYPTVNIVVVVK
jgi:hypothetical protein